MLLRLFTILIISSLLAVGLFGMFGINMINYCPISALSNDNCSPTDSSLAEILHHISGLENFAEGAVDINVSFLMVSVLLIIAFSLFGLTISGILALQISSQGRYRCDKTEFHPSNQQFLRWLALHEKRDPQALQWVHDYS